MSGQAKHTPGPWHYNSSVDTDSDRWLACVSTMPDSGQDASPVIFAFDEEYKPSEADASLIVAAPDLLAACEAALAWRKAQGIMAEEPAWCRVVRAAIAKAEGRS